MKIQYCSDLHLEFAQNALFSHKNSIKPVADILILAGDITLWGQKHFKHRFFDYVSSIGKGSTIYRATTSSIPGGISGYWTNQ